MADTGQVKVVKALFNFKGTNNDELCFTKGDVVTVTQVIEGGWWEGTLNGKTGWFPSNYVKDYKPDGRAGAMSPTGLPEDMDLPMNKRESMFFYHNVVLQSLIDTERTLVTDLLTLLQRYLRPLQSSAILTNVEYSHLVGNLEDIYKLHTNLLASLDECAKLPVQHQRIGGEFMKTAPQLKSLYQAYCANHPKAVAVIQRGREGLCKFMESQGATTPGVMTLTSSLSKPFTRLDKYSNVLKELERHTDESHVDRGDTQRAISVYRDIATSCNEMRKQKEMEFEIMNSNIKGWEGEEISQLGEVILMSHVRVHSENGEKKERLLLLFPSVLVMLSISSRMSGYQYEGKFPVSGMAVNSLEDTESYTQAFEITGSMIDRRTVSCGTHTEMNQWVEALRQQAKLSALQQQSKPLTLQISSPTSVSTVSHAKKATVFQPQQPYKAKKSTWTMSCLRPCPPIRPTVFARDDAAKSPRIGRKSSVNRRKPERSYSEDDYYSQKRKGASVCVSCMEHPTRLLQKDTLLHCVKELVSDMKSCTCVFDDVKTLEDDAHLLKVIEAYCTSAKTRQTVNSSLLDCPQVLIAEEEKIIVEEMKGSQTVVEEKSLVDTVYSLKDQVKDLRQEQRKMRKDLEEERRARKRLETMLRKSLRSLVETTWDDGASAS